MNRIIQILIHNHVFFLFIFLQITLFTYIMSNDFIMQSKMQKHITSFRGNLFSIEKKISDYFNLKKINQQLVNYNNILIQENQLYKLKKNNVNSLNLNITDQAKVVKNSWNKNRNFITINKGKLSNIKSQMGVLKNNQIVGITSIIGENFSTIISLLNTDLMISAKIDKSGHYGTISWDGLHFNRIQLYDIPKHAKVDVGDTIVTSSYSNIFPAGVLIGKIAKYETEKNTNFLKIEVDLFTDFTKIDYVYMIEPEFKKERELIENIHSN